MDIAGTTQVADRVHRLTGGVVNVYLVEDGGKLTLVDAGARGDWRLLAAALGPGGGGPVLADVEAVLVTHAHSDHIGMAERARTETGARVLIHRADEAVARGAKPPGNDGRVTAYLLKAEFYRTLFSLARRGAARIVPVTEVATFDDGATLDVPGRPRVVHAPGHTAGSVAVLLEERRVLLAGDVLCTRNPLTGRVGPQLMPSGLNADTDLAMRSLDALAALPVDVVLPGHGEPFTEGVAEAVRRARAAGRS